MEAFNADNTNFVYFEKPLLRLSEPLVTSVEGWKYVATKIYRFTNKCSYTDVRVCDLVWYCLLDQGEFLLNNGDCGTMKSQWWTVQP